MMCYVEGRPRCTSSGHTARRSAAPIVSTSVGPNPNVSLVWTHCQKTRHGKILNNESPKMAIHTTTKMTGLERYNRRMSTMVVGGCILSYRGYGPRARLTIPKQLRHQDGS